MLWMMERVYVYVTFLLILPLRWWLLWLLWWFWWYIATEIILVMVIMYYDDDNYNEDYNDDDDILQGEAGSEKLAQWWQGGNKPWLQVRLVKIVRLLLFMRIVMMKIIMIIIMQCDNNCYDHKIVRITISIIACLNWKWDYHFPLTRYLPCDDDDDDVDIVIENWGIHQEKELGWGGGGKVWQRDAPHIVPLWLGRDPLRSRFWRMDTRIMFPGGAVRAAVTIPKRATPPRRPRLGSPSRWGWWSWWRWWWWCREEWQKGKNWVHHQALMTKKDYNHPPFRNRPTLIEPLRVASLILSLTTKLHQPSRIKCLT